MGKGLPGLALPIDLPCLQALHQLVRLDVHQLHLLRPVKNAVRDPLADLDPGDGGYQVVQRLQMLHIDGRIDMDAGLQQFLHILIPFCVAAARRVRMGQLIHQNQMGFSLQRQIQIELPQPKPMVLDLCRRKRLQPLQQGQGIRPGVGLDISNDNVNALLLGLMGRFQHGVCFSDSRGVSEEDFESPGSGGMRKMLRF